MNKRKAVFRSFVVLSLLSTHVMCAVVAYNYCNLSWGMRYEGWSAGPSVAYITGLPFLLVAIVCAVAAVWIHRRSRKG